MSHENGNGTAVDEAMVGGTAAGEDDEVRGRAAIGRNGAKADGEEAGSRSLEEKSKDTMDEHVRAGNEYLACGVKVETCGEG